MSSKKKEGFLFCMLLFAATVVLQDKLYAQSGLTKANNTAATLKLNKRFYNSGDMIDARVVYSVVAPMYQQYVIFVSPKTGDAEAIKLKANSATEYVTDEPLKILIGGAKTGKDGVLSVQEGEVIIANYYVSSPKGSNADRQNNNKEMANMVSEFAFIRGTGNYTGNMLTGKQYALNASEEADNAATILVQGQVPIQVARNQLIFYAENEQQWKEFLQYSNCKMLGQANYAGAKFANIAKTASQQQNKGKAYLVEVPVKGQNLNDFGQLRQFLGLKQKVFCSDEDALKLVQVCALANLDGFNVSLNPKMQYNSDAGIAVDETGYFANPPGTGETIPASFTDNFTNIPKVWNYMAIWDRDAIPIRIGIIDYGFDPNNDYRNAATTVQCQVSATGVRCAAGAAMGVPLGGFWDGTPMWHGNAVQGRSGGVLNNNFGTAGTGGQVAVPMIIKMAGFESYAFNTGGAIHTAVDNGANVINMSGGFPCRVLTGLGDFSYCDPGTRGAICAVLFPIVQSASILACSALAWLPFATEICLAATSSAYITACIAQFAIGNPGSIMSEAIQYAKSRGVPVVVSAGNSITVAQLRFLPAELRPFVNLDPNRMTVEDWEVVPAGLPDVICVGAANPLPPYENIEVFGRRVDVWAPTDGNYMAPQFADRLGGPANPTELKSGFNGTSAAAPFIAGLVADAMAVNPQFNRSTSSNIDAIVPALRNLLTTTAWSSTVLPADPAGRRRNLVNPIGFLKEAGRTAGTPLPVISESIYGNDWNTETTESADDATPVVIGYTGTGSSHTGSVIFIPGSGGASNIVDVDRYRVNIPSTYRPTAGETVQLKLRTPAGSRFGNLLLRGSGLVLVRTNMIGSSEEEKVYQGPAIRAGGMTVEFSVEGATPDQDNIYVLSVGNVMLPPPDVDVRVTIPELTELCPQTHVSGDREFGGGPQIDIVANLSVSPDESGVDLLITYVAAERGGDRTTARGEFRRRVYTAPAGNRVVRIEASKMNSEVHFTGRGAGWEAPGFCNEGVVEEPTFTGGLFQRIVVVGDSGGNDVGTATDCRCDTKIKRLVFNNDVMVTIRPR